MGNVHIGSYPAHSAISNLAIFPDQHSVVKQAVLWLETNEKQETKTNYPRQADMPLESTNQY